MGTIGQTWRAAQHRLEEGGINPAPREGQQLVAHALGLESSVLILHEDKLLSDSEFECIEGILARRLNGEPLAYVLGVQPFWAADWQVGPGVLIPRPDSEILVREVLARLPLGAPVLLAEVGVGSGALLGSVLMERPEAVGVGVDISPEALRYARQNIDAQGVAGRCTLLESSVLAGVEGPLALVMSNPPYIPEPEYVALEESVRGYEPKLALLGTEPDGTGFYKALARQAWPLLAPQGWLMVEIGATQGAAVAGIFKDVGFMGVEIVADLANRPRVVLGYKP